MIASEREAKDWLRTLPECVPSAWARLELLVEMLHEECSRQNLVSAASFSEIWRRHIADSAQLLGHVPREASSPWLDLGSGAGFPGLVVAALRPECSVVLVESRRLRAEWLERAGAAMGLSNARVVCSPLAKVETLPMCVISARAFAPLERLLHLSARFSTDSTGWLLPKGRSAQQELAELSGWNHMFHVEQSLTDADAGIVVGTLTGRRGSKQ